MLPRIFFPTHNVGILRQQHWNNLSRESIYYSHWVRQITCYNTIPFRRQDKNMTKYEFHLNVPKKKDAANMKFMKAIQLRKY